MPTAPSNGLTIHYDTFGSSSDPAILLVMGLGAQMTAWEEPFCHALAANHFYVIRFDNRDVGLSSKMESAPAPDVMKAMSGDHSSASYTLWDMADDAFGLLDSLGIARAHVVGASMGGMIVQSMAIKHPERVLSLCSIMSTTGNREVGQSKPEAMAVLMAPPITDRQEVIERAVGTWKLLGASMPFDETAVRERAAATFDRSFYPIGVARQMVGIMAAGDRTEALRQLSMPTLVIHGEEDPLVGLSGGQATAEAVPGAELLVVPKMGHDLHPHLTAQIVEAITANAHKAAAHPA